MYVSVLSGYLQVLVCICFFTPVLAFPHFPLRNIFSLNSFCALKGLLFPQLVFTTSQKRGRFSLMLLSTLQAWVTTCISVLIEMNYTNQTVHLIYLTYWAYQEYCIILVPIPIK